MKKYYVSTCDYAGNFEGLMHLNSKGIGCDSIEDAKEVYENEVSYLISNCYLSDYDNVGYFCSIFDMDSESIVEKSNNYIID